MMENKILKNDKFCGKNIKIIKIPGYIPFTKEIN